MRLLHRHIGSGPFHALASLSSEKLQSFVVAGCSNETNDKAKQRGIKFHRLEVILEYFTVKSILNVIY